MASNIKGITVEIGGNTGPLEKALQGVNKTARNLQSELNQVNRALKFDPSNTTLLAQKQKLLSESIETTKQKLDSLKSVQQQVQQQFASGKIGEDKYRAFQREVETTQNKLSGLEKQLKTSSSELQAFGVKAAEAGEKLNKIGSGVSSAGKSVTMGVTVPLVGAAAAAVKVGNDFETSMSQAAGALDKPMAQMGSLRELALKTGQDTQFSATEAGKAITELAKGGLTEAQIKGGALKATMDLAASSGMELGTAANTVVQSMGAFGLSAGQASQAVNALAGAAAASSTDVEPLSQGLAQCAAQAHMVGWSIQDTTAVLGEFADAGVVGSDAGTSLKTMLQRLGAPTDTAAAAMESLGINVWDSNDHMKNASGIALELQTKMSGLSDAQKQAAMNTIFGSDATRAASILMDKGAEGLKKYTKATNDQSAASRLAKSQMGETSKSIEQMFGALETAAIKIQEALAPVIASIATKIGNLATAFSNLSPTAQKIILVVAGIAAAIGPLLVVIGGLLTTIGTIAGAIGVVTAGVTAATPAIAGLAAVFSVLTGPVGIAIAIISVVAAIAFVVIKNWTPIKAFFKGIWDSIKTTFTGIKTSIEGVWNSVKTTTSNIWNGIKSSLTSIWNGLKSGVVSVFNGIKDAIVTVWNGIKSSVLAIITPIISGILNLWNNMSAGITTVFNGVVQFFTGIWQTIKAIFLGAVLLILDIVTGNFSKLSQDAQLIWTALTTAFSNIWGGIKAVFSGAIQIIASLLSAAWQGISTIVTTVWNGILSFLSGLWNGLVSIASSAWNAMKEAISSIVTNTISIIQSIWNGILSFFSSLPSTLASLGSSMFNAMKDAISSVLSTLGGVVQNGFNSAINFISSLPSKFTQWGRDMIQGLINGITGMIGGVVDTVEGVANTIRSYLHFTVPDIGPLSDADTYGGDFMQLLADTMTQNADKPEEVAKKVADLVSAKIKSIKDTLANDTKDLNDQLYNLNQQEDVSLRGVKGAARYSIQDEYEAKKKALKDEIALRKDQANKEIDEIQKIGKMSKEQIQEEINAKKQAATDIDKLNDVLVKSIERKLNAEKEAAIQSANLKGKEEKLTKDQLSNLLEYVNSYYAEKLDKDALAAQAEQLITSKSQDAIINLLNQYGNLYEDSGLTLGQRLTTGVKSWTDLVPGIVGNAMQNVQAEVQTAAVNVQSTLSNIMQNISTVGAAGAQLAGIDTSFDDIFSKWKDSGMGSTNKEDDPVQKIESKYKKVFNDIELAMVKLGRDTYSTTEEFKKQQDTIDLQNKKLSEMQKEYKEVVNAVGATDDSAVQLEKDIASLNIEIENSTKKLQMDSILDKYKYANEEFDSIISNLTEKNKDFFNEWENRGSIYIANISKMSNLKSEYSEIIKIFGETSDAAKELKNEISDLQKEMDSYAKELKENTIENINDFTSKIKDALKEKYTQQQQAEEDVLNADIEALDQWKEDSIKRINDVYDAKINGIEAQVEAEDRAAMDASELKNIGSLQESIDYEHNEYNKQQLQKQLDKAMADRNKRLHEIEIEEQKAALEQKRQLELDNLDILYDAQKASLDNRLQSIKSFYEKMLDSAHLQAKAEKMVMENNQEEIVELLKSYSSDYENAGRTLGEKLFEGFKSKIESIVDRISSITSQINTARDEAIQAASDAIVSGSVSVTAPTYAGAARQVSSSQTTMVNNNVAITSPVAQTPSQQRTTMENTLRKLNYQMS